MSQILIAIALLCQGAPTLRNHPENTIAMCQIRLLRCATDKASGWNTEDGLKQCVLDGKVYGN